MPTPFSLAEPLLTRDEVAEILRVRRSSLDSSAMHGEGPPYFRIGRSIRYDRATVAEWLVNQTKTPPIKQTT
jgi:predicted DNA-binding transcriptional regulator AlpA